MALDPSSLSRQVLAGLRDSLNRQGVLFGHPGVTNVPEMGPLLAILRGEDEAGASGVFTGAQVQQILNATYTFSQVTDEDAAAVAGFVRIRRLALHASALGAAGLGAIGAGLHGLERLDLGGAKLKRGAYPALAGFRSVRGLVMDDAKFGDDDLPAIAGLGLTLLDLRGTTVSDAGIACLGPVATLEELRFPEGVTDAGLASVAGRAPLVRVQCPARTTDAGVRALAGAGRLEEVTLTRAKIRDAALESLGACGGLRVLDVGRCTGVTDAGVAFLAGCSRLEVLNLAGTKVSGACLATLARLGALRELHLQHQKITDNDVPALAAMSGLRRLMVGRTKLTGPGLATLKRSLRECDVNTLG
jgi:hypothetical protein